MKKKIVVFGILMALLVGVFAPKAQAQTDTSTISTSTKLQIAGAVSQSLASFSVSLISLEAGYVRDQGQFNTLRMQLSLISQQLEGLSRMPMTTPTELQAAGLTVSQITLAANSIAKELSVTQTRYQAQFQVLQSITTTFQALIPLLGQILR